MKINTETIAMLIQAREAHKTEKTFRKAKRYFYKSEKSRI